MTFGFQPPSGMQRTPAFERFGTKQAVREARKATPRATFHTKNGPNQGLNLALAGSFAPNRLKAVVRYMPDEAR